MRAIEVAEPGASLELVERAVPEPGPSEVLVEVDACGICHGDVNVLEGEYPGLSYPRVPGHEIVGRIAAVGDRVSDWTAGDRVGAGWHGGHCFSCPACRRGNFKQCESAAVHGITRDGGYAEYVTVSEEALAAVPEAFDAVDAAPLLCAGLTTFNAIRNADVRPGDLVAVLGIGGLGHLGVQYARQGGFETVALSRGTDKAERARELGADYVVDTAAADPAARLRELGGADLVLSTAPSADAVEAVVGGLATNGQVVSVGVPGEPIGVHAGELVRTQGALEGWAAGHARDAEETLSFSALRGIAPDVERFPLEEAAAAFERMEDGDVRFRAVLEP